MESPQVRATVVITPRDRYSGVEDCIRGIYTNTPIELFDLVILDLGYPKRILSNIEQLLSDKPNAKIISYGKMIPIEGMRKFRDQIETPYVAFIDNDSRVTEGWIQPLLETAEKTGAAIINPVTLEREGVDKGADLRNHLYTNELRVVDVEETPYLIEHKPYRRALPGEIPQEVVPSQSFELHGVMFNTKTLKELELPQMTIREHLDIGMQLQAKGEKIVTDPRSVVIFDNLGTRAELHDLDYFNLRWNGRITNESSRLFEKRWGYKFYSEQSIYNWALRRRIFLVLRWMHIPIPIANKIDQAFFGIRRRLFPIWDPLEDAVGKSEPFYPKCEDEKPQQLSHQIFL